MPKGRFATLTSWSFSVYTQYVRCPFSVCLEKIQRVRMVEPPNPHFAKGDCAHTLAEQCVAGKGRMPPLVKRIPSPEKGAPPIVVDMSALKDRLAKLRGRKALVEQEWAFDRQWNPVDWRDWNRAWVRVKTDVCAHEPDPPVVDIVDWKTGKVHPEHAQQRSLYAAAGLRLVQIGALAGGSKDVRLTAEHVYVDTGQTATEEFTMKDLKPLQREWAARVKGMMADTEFKTHPGRHCRWCKFARSRGGPCPEKM